MVAGLRVNNDHGTVQIDENYNNMFLLNKTYYGPGTFQTIPEPGVSGAGMYYFDLWISAEDFSRSAIRTGYDISIQRMPDPNIIRFRSLDINADFTLYRFGNIQNIGPGYGLKVFRPDGTTSFDSTQNPFRIVHLQNYTSTTNPVVVNLGVQTAFMFGIERNSITQISTGQLAFSILVGGMNTVRYNGNQLILHWKNHVISRQGPIDFTRTWGETGCSGLCVDVTNI